MPDQKPKETDKSADQSADQKKVGGEGGDSSGSEQSKEEAKFSQSDLDRAISKAHEAWARKHQEELEVAQREAEKKRLEEQGKYQELYEKREQELARLQSELKAKQFREEAHAALSELELAPFSEVLLSPRESVEDIRKVGKVLKASFDAAVEAEVLKRLDTGKRPSGGAKGAVSFKDLKSDADKAAFIKEHGQEEYTRLLLQGE